jgi:hypothetical protein
VIGKFWFDFNGHGMTRIFTEFGFNRTLCVHPCSSEAKKKNPSMKKLRVIELAVKIVDPLVMMGLHND